jgi:hypothetical protein
LFVIVICRVADVLAQAAAQVKTINDYTGCQELARQVNILGSEFSVFYQLCVGNVEANRRK